MATVIRGGTIISVTGAIEADMKIEDGIITEISHSIEGNTDDEVIDAAGCYLFPGGIDPHTHLDGGLSVVKSPDNFADGTRAAAVGGITSIINYTNHNPEQSLLADLEEWKQRAIDSVIDYGFHSTVSHFHPDMLLELPDIAAQGVASLKVFMAYRGISMIQDGDMYKLLKEAHKLGMRMNVHAENGDIIDGITAELMSSGFVAPQYHADSRPSFLEAEAVHRATVIAEAAAASLYIVHVSSEAAVREVADAQRRGMAIVGETCPQYLTLDRSYLELEGLEGAKYVCSPPLREQHDQEALWDAIASGIITVVGSDQCSFHATDKIEGAKRGFVAIPNGLPMIEDQFSVMYHYGVAKGRITLQQFTGIMSTNAAKQFGMYPRKGVLQVGSDGDVVIFDPNGSRRISQDKQLLKVDYNVYEGWEVEGVVRHVLSRGELIASEGTYVGSSSRGAFIHRSPSTKLDLNT